jgi:hypothetical protein
VATCRSCCLTYAAVCFCVIRPDGSVFACPCGPRFMCYRSTWCQILNLGPSQFWSSCTKNSRTTYQYQNYQRELNSQMIVNETTNKGTMSLAVQALHPCPLSGAELIAVVDAAAEGHTQPNAFRVADEYHHTASVCPTPICWVPRRAKLCINRRSTPSIAPHDMVMPCTLAQLNTI